MAWVGLIRDWDEHGGAYRKLIVRIEDTQDPGCLVRVYEGDSLVDEELADSPQKALHNALTAVQQYLHNPGITEETLDWVQL